MNSKKISIYFVVLNHSFFAGVHLEFCHQKIVETTSRRPFLMLGAVRKTAAILLYVTMIYYIGGFRIKSRTDGSPEYVLP
jgi:hypothetical protein